MVRLTRVQQQQRTRATVLAAARAEFLEHGYGAAKIDRIAARAELTRGAVYSNFPGKRALYLAVLVDLVARPARDDCLPVPPLSPAEALGTFARTWLERLPLVGDTPPEGRLALRSLTGLLDDEPARTALSHIVRLEALLLALPLETIWAHRPSGARRVRLAELVLTLLSGSGGFAETAPGFGDPFDIARACEHLASIDLRDQWDAPHLPFAAPARATREIWTAPTDRADEISGRSVDLGADGVIAVLGAHRLAAAEEAIRAAGPDDQVTLVSVTSDPPEIGRLMKFRIADLTSCLRRVFPPESWAPLRLVLDEDARVASALSLTDVGDATESAVRIRDGAIIARAEGRGALHAAASTDATAKRRY